MLFVAAYVGVNCFSCCGLRLLCTLSVVSIWRKALSWLRHGNNEQEDDTAACTAAKAVKTITDFCPIGTSTCKIIVTYVRVMPYTAEQCAVDQRPLQRKGIAVLYTSISGAA